MEYPETLKYTKDHEWVAVNDGIATCGITDYAQDALGDIVFVELPAVGDKVEKSKGIGVVESVKSVSDVYAPLSGEITDVNGEIESSPESVNKKPYTDGWLFKIKLSDPSEVEKLMDSKTYKTTVGSK